MAPTCPSTIDAIFAQLIALAGEFARRAFGCQRLPDHVRHRPHGTIPAHIAAIAYADANLPETHVIHSTLPGYIESIKAQIAELEKIIPTVTVNCAPATIALAAWRALHPHVDQTAQPSQPEPARKMGGTFQCFCREHDSQQSKLTAPAEIASNRIRKSRPSSARPGAC